MRARHRLAAGLLATALLGACDAEPAAERSATTTALPGTTAPPIDPTRRSQEIRSEDALGDVDLVTAIEQPRYLEGTDRITVPVRFEGEGRFRITGIAVRTSRFEALPVEAIDVAMVPGQVVALQVDLGPPVCDHVHPPQDPVVLLDVGVDGGPPASIEAPIPSWLVDELHDERCAQAVVTEQVSVRLGEARSTQGATVATDVVLERRGGRERIALTQVTGSVILVLEADDATDPLAEIGPDDAAARVPLTVTAARCDAHAVTGSTKTFVFHAWLQIGDAEPVRIELRPDSRLEATLQEAIAACLQNG